MNISYETVTTLVTNYLLIAALLSVAVSFFMEFVIKIVIPKITSYTFVMNIMDCVLSVAATYAYCFYIKDVSIAKMAGISIVTMAIAMNGYDKIYTYVWSGIKKIFGKTE